MTLLPLMRDGVLAAAELLALLFASPVVAAEPVTTDAAFGRPVPLHRLSTRLDARLLGSLADVRALQTLGDASLSIDVMPARSAVERIDADAVARLGERTEVRVDAGVDAPCAGHVRLTEDELIADAFQRARTSRAAIATAPGRPLDAGVQRERVRLSLPAGSDGPQAIVFNENQRGYLLLVPNRAAARAALVLRFAAGPSRTLDLGSVDARHAILVPLGGRPELNALTAGAIELELADGSGQWWSTLVPQCPDLPPAIQASGPE